MIYFPQLSTGVTGQLPLRWTDNFRAVLNALPDGSQILLSDGLGAAVAWSLSFSGLSELERQTLQAFFDTTRGALNSFTMLDPSDNLLAYSEDFTQACWAPEALLRVNAGSTDPFGGTGAFTLTNTAQAAQAISQQINGPGSYGYCLSLYLRSGAPQTVSLTQCCNGSTLGREVSTTGAWQRASLSGAVGSGDGVSFGVEVPSGGQVQIFGAQVEAQPAAGTYKRTTTTGGVYQNCRFDQDELQMTATAPGAYRCTLRIRSVGHLPWAA